MLQKIRLHPIKKDRDKCDKEIQELFYRESNFKIYKTSDLVTYEINSNSAEGDQRGDTYFINNLVEIQPLLAEVHYLQKLYPDGWISKLLYRRTKELDRVIAYGLFVALKGSMGEDCDTHIKTSKVILTESIKHLNQAISFESKFSHLAGGSLAMIIFSTLTVLSIYFANGQQNQEAFLLTITSDTPDNKIPLITLMSTLLYGTIGGFMSIAVNIRKLRVIPELKPFWLGILRVLIASISAVIVLLGIQSKLLFDLTISEETFPLIKLAAFAAGLSEDTAVNLASQLLHSPEKDKK